MTPELYKIAESYFIRRLEKQDFYKGYVSCLEQLTVVGSLTYDHFEDVLNFWKQTADTYFPMVIIFIPQAPNVIVGDATTINNEGLLLVEEEVVGVGTLVVEQKLIRSCGKAGHIEDIVISEHHRGKNLGKLLIDYLINLAKTKDCYKVILNCQNDKLDFYQKCGLELRGLQMAKYLR